MNRARQRSKQSSKNSQNSSQPHPPLNQPSNVAKRPLPQIPPIDTIDDPEEDEIQNKPDENEDNNSQKVNLTKTGRSPEDAWLDNLPPVEKPDEELHKELVKKRHEERKQKVFKICQTELNGILNYSFGCIDLKNTNKKKTQNNSEEISQTAQQIIQDTFENNRYLRILRAKFRNGDLSPEVVKETHDPEMISTILTPLHSLDVKQYLHFKSDSYLSDLSLAFNVNLSDSNLEDPNPFFNTFLSKLHKLSETFTSPYHPYDKLPFPFIVCVGGLTGGGKTTITQFLQKAFDAHIMDVKPSNLDISSPSGKRKKQQTIEGSSQPIERTPQYPLKDCIKVEYQDEKTASREIVSFIKSNFDGRGFIIDGYPNNKTQFANLEKELVSAGINMKEQQNKLKVMQIPQRSKGQNTSIDGLIIALNNEENRERLIDPETGNVHNKNFNMLDLSDLIEINPTEFQKTKEEIENRLIAVTVPEIQILAPKALQAYNQYESTAKKTCTTITIKHCDTLNEFLELIDGFIMTLYAKFPNLLPHKKKNSSNQIIQDLDNPPLPPLMTLMKPTWLVLPHQCYEAVTTWYNCLELFGRTIADQGNLVQTLDTKHDVLKKAALERFQLLIGQKDDRLKVCNDYIEKGDTSNLSQLFRVIWELSLKVRDNNLKYVDEIVCKSGLIELLIELRKTPKLVFIALVQRLLYVKWFYETFHHLIPIDEKKRRNRLSIDAINDILNDESQTTTDNQSSISNNDSQQENHSNNDSQQENHSNNELEQSNNSNNNENDLNADNDKDNNSINNDISFFEQFTSQATEIPLYQLQKKIESQVIENNIEATIPPIDIQLIEPEEPTIQTTRPVHPPDSSSDHKRIRNIPDTSRNVQFAHNDIEEKKSKREKHDFSYLMTTLNYYSYSTEESEYEFDCQKACEELSIEFIDSITFDDPSNYASKFFDYVESQTKQNELLEKESETSKKIFNRFMHLCQSKEEAIVESVIELRDQLKDYSRCKCTYEMESFARRFRLIKQLKTRKDELNNQRDELQRSRPHRCSFYLQTEKSKENVNDMKRFVAQLDGPLFAFDIDHVDQNIKKLIKLELTFETPIIIQRLISPDFVMKLVQICINQNIETISVSEFIEILENAKSELNFNDDEIKKIEIVVRIVENVECFDLQEFILCLAHDREEESKIMQLFKEKKNEKQNEEIQIKEEEEINQEEIENEEISQEIDDHADEIIESKNGSNN